MAIRIVGVDLPQNKRGEVALTSFMVSVVVQLTLSWQKQVLIAILKYKIGQMIKLLKYVKLSVQNIR